LNLSGFELWNQAIELDKVSLIPDSKAMFEKAAKVFFDEAGTSGIAVSRPLFEYSTLMDASASVQEGRISKSRLDYDDSLVSFAKSSEILRATVHFGFMAPYVSACASLETAMEMEDDDEKFQGFKNSIALLEQSKLALSFRDDRHPLLHSIDILIKFAISRALLVESAMMTEQGNISDSEKKLEQSRNVENEIRKMTSPESPLLSPRYRIDYFLKAYDTRRAGEGAFITTFPEKTGLWIGNVGTHSALVESLGNSVIHKMIEPRQSIWWPLSSDFRGKLRIRYEDLETSRSFDEGCLTAI